MSYFKSLVFDDFVTVRQRCFFANQSIAAGFILPPSNDTFCDSCKWHNGSVSQLFVNHPSHIIFFYIAVYVSMMLVLQKAPVRNTYVPPFWEVTGKALVVVLIFSFHTCRDGDMLSGLSPEAVLRKKAHDALVFVLGVGTAAAWWRRWSCPLPLPTTVYFVCALATSGFFGFFLGWNLESPIQSIVIHCFKTVLGFCRKNVGRFTSVVFFAAAVVVLFVADRQKNVGNACCRALSLVLFLVAGFMLNLCLINMFAPNDVYNWGFILEANALFATLL